MLIVDPTQPDALHVANYYQRARGIPARNVIYMNPIASDYTAFTQFQLPALTGTLANRAIDDQIDYVVVAPARSFYVDAPNLVDGAPCPATVYRLSISSAYGLAYSADEILGGTLNTFEPNRYYANDDTPQAFNSRTSWLNGIPGAGAGARRYFVGFMLGYTGPLGNTVDDLLDMIDRGVAVDGTRPNGTFYLMKTTDSARSPPRDALFSTTIAGLAGLGGVAEQIDADLPLGRHDALGVMTGKASLPIDEADLTLLPGSFADHLTSYAGRFDGGGQTKMSRWIAKGASGTAGTVEEPCAFGSGRPGKFPHPRLFVWYYQGMSLGESLQRSIPWTPFQTLFYGDPLTRAFTRSPTVTVLGLPAEAASGTVILRPEAQRSTPGQTITGVDLFMDGARFASAAPREAFVVETTALADGYHDLRVVAYENDLLRSQGQWTGTLRVDNFGLAAQIITVFPDTGDRDTVYHVVFGVPAELADRVTEIRLLQGSRVLAATSEARKTVELSGRDLGAGPVEIVAVAEFDDGRLAVSEPHRFEIAPDGGQPPAQPGFPGPSAWSYTLDVLPGQPILLDLPATDLNGDVISRTLVTEPSQATVASDGVAWLLTPNGDATGSDEATFEATDGASTSEPAKVTIRYCTAPQITSQPVNTEVCPGEPAQFEVAAAGERLRYRWFRNGFPIPGADAATLTIDRADYADAGNYEAEVTQMCGLLSRAARSQSANLAISTGERCRKLVYLPYNARNGRAR